MSQYLLTTSLLPDIILINISFFLKCIKIYLLIIIINLTDELMKTFLMYYCWDVEKEGRQHLFVALDKKITFK